MKCSFTGCENLSLSLETYCWDHLSNKAEYAKKIAASIQKGDDLTGYNLHKIVLKNASLERARLTRSNLSQADLSGSHLFDVVLEGADLVGADLSSTELTHCTLKGADLTKANLKDARLWNANLTDANLAESDLSGADLWNANLFNVKLWHTNLTETKSLEKRNFSKEAALLGAARINEAGLLSAEESYRNLKRYFLANGMYNDASWASYKEKVLEMHILKKNGDLHYLPSLIMNILCGYGEKPHRIVISAFSAILLFAFIYFMLNAVENTSVPGYFLRWSDYIYYSTITFTTVGYGDFIPKPFTLFRLLAASEAFMGVYLTGLFIFTLARKYSAR